MMLNNLRSTTRTFTAILFLILMLSLLLSVSACGQANSVDSTISPVEFQNSVSSILVVVKTERARSYNAVVQLEGLEANNMLPLPGNGDYYTNGYNFYMNTVRSEFNGWLDNIESEISADNIVNNFDDKLLEYQALQDNESFVEWAQTVFDYFNPSSTGSVPSYHGGYLTVQIQAGEPGADIGEVTKDAVKQFTKEELDSAIDEIKKEIIKSGAEWTIAISQLELAKWGTWGEVLFG